MSAEIQTSLFILTAELAAVSTLAALGAGIAAWLFRRQRMRAAMALREAAERLPGEGEMVQRERALLAEFARAYLTRDAVVLGELPKALLDLRHAYEQTHQDSAGAADSQQAEALQAEKEVLQARVEMLERQQALTAQQLEGALATINTLVQEYGRGRGVSVAPTSEALLQALLAIQGEGRAQPVEEGAADRQEVPAAGVGRPAEAVTEDGVEDALADALAEVAQPVGPFEDQASLPGEEVDAPQADVQADALTAEAPQAAPAATAGHEPAPPPVPDEPAAAEAELDLSVPVAPVEGPPAEEPRDELDTLDIDALLDAELSRQAELLAPAPSPSEEDLDLARTEDLPGKK
jgi:ribosomal protein L16/L10AE